MALFIGSGLSTWSGLPSWSALLLGLIEDAETRGRRTRLARDAHANGDLLDAADKLADVMTQLEMVTVMRRDLRFAEARPHPIHSLVTRLGPERFLTTNYDSLIEQQLGLEGRLGSYRTVTNRQLAELADIQKASANPFVFKPHGDIADAESLILSSTHYNRILLGLGNPVRSVLETLFASRPILFIGYSLRDPDTMLVLRALNERYSGFAGQFWAVIADADDELSDFWRRQHNVHLVGYSTRPGPAGADHSALLDLLRRLVEAREAADASRSRRVSGEAPLNAELMRYAARLIKPEPAVQLPVRAHLQQRWEGGHVPPQFAGPAHAELVTLFDEYPGSFVLEGPAGAGKSFAIGTHLSRVGRRLLEWCLLESPEGDPPVVPILLDARLYQGSFARLAKATVPATLNLNRVSKTHQIILFVDSLDEMPAEHLESAHWRTDLHAFVAEFPRVHTVYGTRRQDLVGDPSLPCYSIGWLDERIVEDALAEVGRERLTIKGDLFDALRTPFTLMLGRRFLGRRSDITSAPSLFAFFVNGTLDRICGQQQSAFLQGELSTLAAKIVVSGRETVPIADLAERFNGILRLNGTDKLGTGRDFVDRLVEANVFTSEIDGHVRFVHRSVTEFLAAQHVVTQWRANRVALADLLATRRWDNSVAWVAAALTPDEAQGFVREVYRSDRVLAVRIARAAEIGRARMLATVLDALADDRLGWADEGGVGHFLKNCELPQEVAPRLRPLLAGGDHLAGVAAGLLVPYFSEDELRGWIDRIGRGQITYNMMNELGPALGKRLTGDLLHYLLKVFGATRFAPTDDPGGRECADAVAHRHGFETTISGLSEPDRHKVMAWSRRRNAAVRGIVCAAISRIHRLPEQRYLVQEMERGTDEAVFNLYLMLRYRGNEWQGPVPACTARRVTALVEAVRASKRERTKWALHLLQCLAERDAEWSTALQEAARSDHDPALRSVLLAIDPGSERRIAQEFLERALRSAPSLATIEREAVDVLADAGLALDEGLVLKSIARHGAMIFELLDPFWITSLSNPLPILIKRIDDWVEVLVNITATKALETRTFLPLAHAIQYVAEAVTDEASRRLLERANSPTDQDRDFILARIVWLMSNITTDDLTSETARRLVELYCREGGGMGRSPGQIATERFVTRIVLPYAETLEDDGSARAAIENILQDAGHRHGRRYKPPWSRRGREAPDPQRAPDGSGNPRVVLKRCEDCGS